MNTALKIYISNENLAESLNYFSTCTLLLLIITIEGMLYFGKRRKTKMEHVLIIQYAILNTGPYQGPPVAAPPQYYAAPPPPRREPSFLEGWCVL